MSKFATRLGLVLAGGAVAGLSIPLAMRGPASEKLEAQRFPWARKDHRGDTLRVMTLNIAHGRRDGFHQLLCSRPTIEKNLADIAAELDRQTPDIVALQEADGPSVWSGNFDHVRFIASAARFHNYVRGEHVRGLRLAYGTALLGQLPLDNAESIAFAPSPPTPSKGFVVSTLTWPGRPDVSIDVVSIHLDFARTAVRRAQLAQLAETLRRRGLTHGAPGASRAGTGPGATPSSSPSRPDAGDPGTSRPLIVMGDFNCEFAAEKSPLQALASALNLRAYEPAAKLVTFPGLGTRLDWILVSPGLDFVDYRTLDATLSDHRGVVAELKLARSTPAPRAH